ncbi:MAG: hypothetical protein WAS21_03420 [Geminicoccaceae bacterium]
MLAGTAALTGAAALGRRSRAAGRILLRPPAHWAGINHGTGFFPDEPFLSACIQAGNALGLKAVRQRMNTVGGRHVGAAFTWARRDAAFAGYRDAGCQIHCILSFREHVDRPSAAEWQRNWRYFVRAAMDRYRDHVHSWIIDNEPELGFGGYHPTPQECVEFTRIAWEELHDLGIDDRCRIESPPVKAINSDYLRLMLEAGLADWCHVLGTHCYNDQIDDERIRYPWAQLRALGIDDLPVAISESGVIEGWAPEGYPGGGATWRADHFRQFHVQAKAFGFEYVLLFDLDRWTQREQEWRIADFSPDGAECTPLQPIWDAVRESWGGVRRFTNSSFTAPEDGSGNWVVYRPARAATPVELERVSFPRDADRSLHGSGYCRMDLADHRQDLVVRQVADLLTPGHTYAVEAKVLLTGGAATLRATGFDRLDGLASRSAVTTRPGAWATLAVQVEPTNPWLVVELRSKGTGARGDEVRWGEVTVMPVG